MTVLVASLLLVVVFAVVIASIATNARRTSNSAIDTASVSAYRTLMSGIRTSRALSLNSDGTRVTAAPRDADAVDGRAVCAHGVSSSQSVPAARARSPCRAWSDAVPQPDENQSITVAPQPEASY